MEPRIADKPRVFIVDLKRRWFSTHEKFVSRRNEKKITEPQMGPNKFTFF